MSPRGQKLPRTFHWTKFRGKFLKLIQFFFKTAPLPLSLCLCRTPFHSCTFQTFLGQRYGSQTFPSKIDENEFNILLSCLDSSQDPSTQLIRQWFVCNENTIPPRYELKPISSHFPDFLSQVRIGHTNPVLRFEKKGPKWHTQI